MGGMGEVKNQLFLQYISKGLEDLRAEFRKKYTPKKDNRFLIRGITYEIGPCHIDSEGYFFEISSKIPQELLPQKMTIDKYFKEVVKLVNRSSKKPVEFKMENIIKSSEEEIKERDYVKLVYRYKESELYTPDEVEKTLKKHIAKGIPIPDAPGVATPMGKMVLYVLEESVKENIRQNLINLLEANDSVKKEFEGKIKARPAIAASKKENKPRKAKAASKPVVKKKTSSAKPTAKKASVKKSAAKKPALKKKPAQSVKTPSKGKAKPSPSKKAQPKKVRK